MLLVSILLRICAVLPMAHSSAVPLSDTLSYNSFCTLWAGIFLCSKEFAIIQCFRQHSPANKVCIQFFRISAYLGFEELLLAQDPSGSCFVFIPYLECAQGVASFRVCSVALLASSCSTLQAPAFAGHSSAGYTQVRRKFIRRHQLQRGVHTNNQRLFVRC